MSLTIKESGMFYVQLGTLKQPGHLQASFYFPVLGNYEVSWDRIAETLTFISFSKKELHTESSSQLSDFQEV